MNSRLGLIGVSLLFVLATLAACGGGGSSDGSAAAPNGGGAGGGTPPKAWGTAVLIGNGNVGGPTFPRVAVDARGNALAVWYQSDSTRANVWSNRYTAGAGWGTASLMETDAEHAFAPKIAIDGNGNGLAVWEQISGMRFNRYTTATGWGTPALIETGNAGGGSDPQIAIDPNGNTLAVWATSDGTRTHIWANRYRADSGWGTAALIENDDASFNSPQIAIDHSGNGIAVWHQSGGNIWSNRYTAGSGWGTAALIETSNAGRSSRDPQIAFDANGNALAVWVHFDGATNNIWFNRYSAGTGWGTAAHVDTGASAPKIAIEANGNALAVWQEFDGERPRIASNRYADTRWGTTALIDTYRTSDTATFLSMVPQIAIDLSGNGIAVWHQSDGTRSNIWSNRYTAGAGWGTAMLIETDNAGDAFDAQIAFDANGNALAVWSQSDGTRTNTWANRFQ